MINLKYTFSQKGFRNHFHRANPCVTFREKPINPWYQSVKAPLVLPYAAIMDHLPWGISLLCLLHGREFWWVMRLSPAGAMVAVWCGPWACCHGGKNDFVPHINYGSKPSGIYRQNSHQFCQCLLNVAQEHVAPVFFLPKYNFQQCQLCQAAFIWIFSTNATG